MTTLHWSDCWYLAPELVLAAFAVLLALLDLLLPARVNRDIIGWLVLAGLLAAGFFVAWQLRDLRALKLSAAPGDYTLPPAYSLMGNSYRVDAFGSLLKLAFLAATFLIVLASLGTLRKDSTVKGEFYYLLLPAVLGAMVMASSGDLITLFVGLELLSITSYVLVALRKSSGVSGEAAFKYFVAGGTASAFILYGMSFLYGLTGSTNLAVIAPALGTAIINSEALVYVAFFLLLAGFALKLALAPFHAWAPDVYEGAPTPVTAFLAVVAKGAALAMLYRIWLNLERAGGPTLNLDLRLALAVLAGCAMVVGTAGALRQRQAKRLLALSGVAGAGVLLIPLTQDFSSLHSSVFTELIYYLIAYVFMNVGAFAVVSVVSGTDGNGTLSAFAGLYHRAPWTAAAMTLLLCSLAGIPLTGGFMGKLLILFGAFQMKGYALAGILLATTVVGYYVYFTFVRQMYMRSGSSEAKVSVSIPTGLVIWLSVGATLVLGVMPTPMIRGVKQVFSLVRDTFYS